MFVAEEKRMGQEEYEEGDLEEEEEEENGGDDWDDWGEDDEGEEAGWGSNFLCLFCDEKYGSCGELFEHCRLTHKFDFRGMKGELGLDFYGCFKLINYVRSQVAEKRCWSCGFKCDSKEGLWSHLHEPPGLKDIKGLWGDDKYLNPVMPDDALLYSFDDEEEEDDGGGGGGGGFAELVDKDEIMKALGDIEKLKIEHDSFEENVMKEVASTSNGEENAASCSSCSKMVAVNGLGSGEHLGLSDGKRRDNHSKASLMNLAAKDIKKVDENYFGSYSSFGIHREMLSDKVRMDAYQQAISKNPSLFTGAVVMDVGCGTGILSLFSAQAGASRVIAVEASKKMAAVATQVAKENNLWWNTSDSCLNQSNGVVEVVQGMVEEIDKSVHIEPHSIDVILSEWMGYCLLYESMLSSVLFARDKWLKPGGAILPDTATIYAAGFGKGGTSLPFWEDVYGFNMSSIGKELVQDAARIPIVDVVDVRDIVTDAVALLSFDLATMKHDDVDFTAAIDLRPKSTSDSTTVARKTMWCYGVVLWFDTGFTSRFCKETPAVLSTAPYTPRTHWSQTILTFREPIAMASENLSVDSSDVIGTETCPAAKVHLRISIARASEHRSIDISLEVTGVGPNNQTRNWPAQIFNLS